MALNLRGLPAETQKQIREQIKAARKISKTQEEQDYEKYWTGLDALRKQIDALVDKAKASGSIPRGTTLKRLTLMPKTKPARWSSAFKRIFGRKTRKTTTKKKMVKAKAKITRQKQQRKAT
tara:strand:+ start:2137 stop:2499 length:363 start_codon:yes stop_codon:yes gene_type:complete